MNGNYRYEVRGSQALACRYIDGEERNIIDYDVARRSFEARMRLEQRRQRTDAATRSRTHAAHERAESRITLSDVARSSYTPKRTMLDALADAAHNVACAIREHPFVDQLRHGSAAGKQMGETTYRQAFSTGAACMALSAVLVFVGM